ncbi:MAG: cation diffusion facilitator family transporter [Bacteroidales bacterium]|jgi:cobalt-zinc-cadmium efflux system protein|nr:cation diffusion facilitator family transporter [Bacteroidales bacterium]
MSHSHKHSTLTEVNKAFFWAISINIIFVIIEFVSGFIFNSVGLISDAGHNLGDITSLALSVFALKISHLRPNKTYTYGYKKTTVLISLFNAIILLVTVGFILTESIHKLTEPKFVKGLSVVIVAAIGVIVNGFTAWLFVKHKKQDLNVKSAYLHMAADTLVSIGVVLSGIVIMFTDWFIIDAIIGIVIALVILYSTWNLLIESIKLSLDAVPTSVNREEIEKILLNIAGVKDIHHIHIWALSTNEVALTSHIVVDNYDNIEKIKHKIKHELAHHGIEHATLEFEINSMDCEENHC